MVIIKRDGGIYIFADFKMTMFIQIYPLHTCDEIFLTLANGESSIKLDLVCSYKQMKVAADSQKYLTINTRMAYADISYCV